MSHRADFDQDGFVHLRRFLDAETIAELTARAEALIQDKVPDLAGEHVFYEDRDDPTTLKQIQHLERHDAAFGRLLHESQITRLALQLLGESVRGRNLQYFAKPSSSVAPTPPHQDGFYFKLSEPRAVTIWVPLEEVPLEGGCVRYTRGSHTEGLREHTSSGVLGFSQSIESYGSAGERAREVPCPASPGDVLAHHALTIHRADANAGAGGSRRALGLIYYAASAHEDELAHTAYQVRLARELREAGRV